MKGKGRGMKKDVGVCSQGKAREGEGLAVALRAGSPGWAEGCTPGRPPALHDCRSSGVWGCREPGILVPVAQLGSSH